MSDLPRRPKTIWIAQILLLLAGIPLSLIAIVATLRDVALLVSNGVPFSSVGWLIAASIFRIGVVALFAFAFWGLVKRARYGRWLSIAVFLLLLTMSILGQVYRPSGPMEYYEYENSAERMGGFFGSILIYGLFALLLYRLAFGESVSEFFKREPEDDSYDVPPPPPTVYNDEPRGTAF